MYEAHKGEIVYKLDKELQRLFTSHSHNTKPANNKFHLPRISTSHGNQILPQKGVKLWFAIDTELKILGEFFFKKKFLNETNR